MANSLKLKAFTDMISSSYLPLYAGGRSVGVSAANVSPKKEILPTWPIESGPVARKLGPQVFSPWFCTCVLFIHHTFTELLFCACPELGTGVAQPRPVLTELVVHWGSQTLKYYSK